jgi:hypothetical protein
MTKRLMNVPPITPSIGRPSAGANSGIGSAKATGSVTPASPTRDSRASRIRRPVCVPGPAPPTRTSPSNASPSSMATSVRTNAAVEPVSRRNDSERELPMVASTRTWRVTSSNGIVMPSRGETATCARLRTLAPALDRSSTSAMTRMARCVIGFGGRIDWRLRVSLGSCPGVLHRHAVDVVISRFAELRSPFPCENSPLPAEH